MNLPTLMIHQVTPEIFELPLEEYILTFDDGLFGQFHYFPYFQKLNTRKIFFISTGIIAQSTQSFNFPNSKIAHQKAFAGNTEDYMTLDQIKELKSDPLVTIGAHSHSHTKLSSFNSLVQKVAHIEEDTTRMLDWFHTNLNFTPDEFCFPYNDDMGTLYRGLLRKYGFTKFYGSERIPVERLLHRQDPLGSLDI